VRVKCPHGYKSVAKLGSITIENETVEILEGICDRPDRCGITTCEYFDTSRDATRRFQQAHAHACTLEGLMGEYLSDPCHLVPHFRLETLAVDGDDERQQEIENAREVDGQIAAWTAQLLTDGLIERIGTNRDGSPRYRLTNPPPTFGKGA